MVTIYLIIIVLSSFQLSLISANNFTECLNTGRNIEAWYTPNSVDINNNTWSDISGNNNHGIIGGASNEINVESWPNGKSYITGTTSTIIMFQADLHPTQHTVFCLTKYNGNTRERIIATNIDNGLFGHWD